MANPRYIARGNILPSTIVKIDTTSGHNFGVIAATATSDKPVGIAQAGTHDAPGTNGAGTYAASDGQEIRVYGDGEECLGLAGAAITQGDNLIFVSGAKLTPHLGSETSDLYIVGQALESASGDGVLFRMLVRPQFVRAHA